MQTLITGDMGYIITDIAAGKAGQYIREKGESNE